MRKTHVLFWIVLAICAKEKESLESVLYDCENVDLFSKKYTILIYGFLKVNIVVGEK